MNEKPLNELIAAISEYAEADMSHLDATSPLSNAIPGMDSLQLQELLLYLEDRFRLTLDEHVMGSVKTLGDLASYIEQHSTST